MLVTYMLSMNNEIIILIMKLIDFIIYQFCLSNLVMKDMYIPSIKINYNCSIYYFILKGNPQRMRF